MRYRAYFEKMHVIEIKYINDEVFTQVYFILSKERFRANIVQQHKVATKIIR